MELCLFDASGRETRVDLPSYTDEVWHGYVPEVEPGLLYGYRVHGRYEPEHGLRFNPHKLVLDPYARALAGTLDWSGAHFGHQLDHPRADLSFCTRDNAATMLKAQVVDMGAPSDHQRPSRSWQESVLYELHVRGFTMRHPDVHESYRGTFAGMAAPAVIGYLKALGITAVELMPVHASVDDRHLVRKGLRNYWGYNSIGFFAPHPLYLARGDVLEFRTLVRALHDAGIEVILDVVYNHTAEGNHMGPTLSFRGIDNPNYYRLVPGNERYYMDSTGCGNTLNLRHHRVLQLVMDSLRYWVEHMEVDGFRFDLTSAMARDMGHFDRQAGFLGAVRQDPVLSRVKMIAEPWDVGDGGYQLGNFPPGWREWNDRFRDTVRGFWRGDPGQVPEMASRITGSADVFDRRGRAATSSLNFVTAHDGFTLMDLVSYDHKHNEANAENNGDGTNDNRSWNHGVEGPTDDLSINAVRMRQRLNMLATLLLSQGVPMLLAGDEVGHSQRGNNNPYCQDNDITWLDWEHIPASGHRLARMVSWLIRLRRDHVVFHREQFFQGEEIPGTDLLDTIWLNPDGQERQVQDWENGETRFLGLLLRGDAGTHHRTATGEPQPDDSFLIFMNAGGETLACRLPALAEDGRWRPLLDTSLGPALCSGPPLADGDTCRMVGRSLMLFQRVEAHDTAGTRAADHQTRPAVGPMGPGPGVAGPSRRSPPRALDTRPHKGETDES
ncbi:glycogen operon protein [Roseospira visakhapatnamensis]|uniref:Glycogen operon protein n=1 Tax=Roseospira visakhapatnamensis TaxID=390880 RepID=A0A7W6RBU5_9PROT|nr:glycogen operon protein [Roseospira visakhapatnamensis]